MVPSTDEQRLERALAALARGEIIVVTDDEDRENEGDLIMSGQFATPEKLTFFIRHTSGVVCAALPAERCETLGLPLMVERNSEAMRTAFTDTVDAARGVTTGISAADRATTIQVLADPEARPGDLVRPGHIFPLRAVPGGVLKRPGHTEASVDLCRLAGVAQVGVLCEVVNDDGTMARGPGLEAFATKHGLCAVSIAELVRYRRRTEPLVERVGESFLPTLVGTFRAVAYRGVLDDAEHLALVMGDPTIEEPILVRVHSECLTGDVFGSLRCDCGDQLSGAMERIGAAGRGVIVYLRGHEGRGIGLAHKIRAYSLQDGGLDTIDANVALGLPIDDRDYGIGAQILADLGVHRMRLITNNPGKYAGIAAFDLEITERVSVPSMPTIHNLEYLRTKRDRMGHLVEFMQEFRR